MYEIQLWATVAMPGWYKSVGERGSYRPPKGENISRVSRDIIPQENLKIWNP